MNDQVLHGQPFYCVRNFILNKLSMVVGNTNLYFSWLSNRRPILYEYHFHIFLIFESYTNNTCHILKLSYCHSAIPRLIKTSKCTSRCFSCFIISYLFLCVMICVDEINFSTTCIFPIIVDVKVLSLHFCNCFDNEMVTTHTKVVGRNKPSKNLKCIWILLYF